MRITRLTAQALRVPVHVTTSFSTRSIDERHYVLVRLATDDGVEGIGYTYAGTAGGPWLAAAVNELLAPLLMGRDVGALEENWTVVYRELLLLGRRGALLRALSAVDIAGWDALGKATDMPLRRLLGGSGDRVPAYASGGYYRPGDAVENVRTELRRYQDLGFTRFKIKVGGLPLDEDVTRVAAARELIGSGALALDANNAWDSSDEALHAARAFEPYGIWWLEEPLSPDDVQGHARLTAASPIPIATGEIEATRWAFGDLLAQSACDILQPDACVAGGVSEWMKIAHAAAAFGKSVAPHWHANLHAQLALAVGNCPVVEFFALAEDIYNFEAIVKNRLAVAGGEIELDEAPGIGVVLDEDAVSKFTIGRSGQSAFSAEHG
jgi:L-alanine-DL-glutamate epimerase-like enolase superfamily enzyme